MSRTSDRNYVVRSGGTNTSVPVALAAGVAKTVIACLGSSSDTIGLVRVQVSFDSISGSAVPALVEIGITTSLGTVTSMAPSQWKGATVGTSVTAGYNATVEPAYNRILDSAYVPVLMGYLDKWFALGSEPQADPSQGFAVRVTAPAAVNCYANLIYSE